MLAVRGDKQRDVQQVSLSEGETWPCVAGQSMFKSIFPQGFREDVAFLRSILSHFKLMHNLKHKQGSKPTPSSYGLPRNSTTIFSPKRYCSERGGSLLPVMDFSAAIFEDLLM